MNASGVEADGWDFHQLTGTKYAILGALDFSQALTEIIQSTHLDIDRFSLGATTTAFEISRDVDLTAHVSTNQPLATFAEAGTLTLGASNNYSVTWDYSGLDKNVTVTVPTASTAITLGEGGGGAGGGGFFANAGNLVSNNFAAGVSTWAPTKVAILSKTIVLTSTDTALTGSNPRALVVTVPVLAENDSIVFVTGTNLTTIGSNQSVGYFLFRLDASGGQKFYGLVEHRKTDATRFLSSADVATEAGSASVVMGGASAFGTAGQEYILGVSGSYVHITAGAGGKLVVRGEMYGVTGNQTFLTTLTSYLADAPNDQVVVAAAMRPAVVSVDGLAITWTKDSDVTVVTAGEGPYQGTGRTINTGLYKPTVVDAGVTKSLSLNPPGNNVYGSITATIVETNWITGPSTGLGSYAIARLPKSAGGNQVWETLLLAATDGAQIDILAHKGHTVWKDSNGAVQLVGEYCLKWPIGASSRFSRGYGSYIGAKVSYTTTVNTVHRYVSGDTVTHYGVLLIFGYASLSGTYGDVFGSDTTDITESYTPNTVGLDALLVPKPNIRLAVETGVTIAMVVSQISTTLIPSATGSNNGLVDWTIEFNLAQSTSAAVTSRGYLGSVDPLAYHHNLTLDPGERFAVLPVASSGLAEQQNIEIYSQAFHDAFVLNPEVQENFKLVFTRFKRVNNIWVTSYEALFLQECSLDDNTVELMHLRHPDINLRSAGGASIKHDKFTAKKYAIVDVYGVGVHPGYGPGDEAVPFEFAIVAVDRTSSQYLLYEGALNATGSGLRSNTPQNNGTRVQNCTSGSIRIALPAAPLADVTTTPDPRLVYDQMNSGVSTRPVLGATADDSAQAYMFFGGQARHTAGGLGGVGEVYAGYSNQTQDPSADYVDLGFVFNQVMYNKALHEAYVHDSFTAVAAPLTSTITPLVTELTNLDYDTNGASGSWQTAMTARPAGQVSFDALTKFGTWRFYAILETVAGNDTQVYLGSARLPVVADAGAGGTQLGLYGVQVRIYHRPEIGYSEEKRLTKFSSVKQVLQRKTSTATGKIAALFELEFAGYAPTGPSNAGNVAYENIYTSNQGAYASKVPATYGAPDTPNQLTMAVTLLTYKSSPNAQTDTVEPTAYGLDRHGLGHPGVYTQLNDANADLANAWGVTSTLTAYNITDYSTGTIHCRNEEEVVDGVTLTYLALRNTVGTWPAGEIINTTSGNKIGEYTVLRILYPSLPTDHLLVLGTLELMSDDGSGNKKWRVRVDAKAPNLSLMPVSTNDLNFTQVTVQTVNTKHQTQLQAGNVLASWDLDLDNLAKWSAALVTASPYLQENLVTQNRSVNVVTTSYLQTVAYPGQSFQKVTFMLASDAARASPGSSKMSVAGTSAYAVTPAGQAQAPAGAAEVVCYRDTVASIPMAIPLAIDTESLVLGDTPFVFNDASGFYLYRMYAGPDQTKQIEIWSDTALGGGLYADIPAQYFNPDLYAFSAKTYYY